MTPSNLPWRPGKQPRSSRPSAGSRLRRWLVGGVVVGCAGSALNVTLVVTSASGTGTALYTCTPPGRATSPATCPRTTSTNERCTLGEAGSRAVPGTKVLLGEFEDQRRSLRRQLDGERSGHDLFPANNDRARTGRRPAHPGRQQRTECWVRDQGLRRTGVDGGREGSPGPRWPHHPGRQQHGQGAGGCDREHSRWDRTRCRTLQFFHDYANANGGLSTMRTPLAPARSSW